MYSIEIKTTSGNWSMKIGDDTFMFGLIKSIFHKSPNNQERKKFDDYLHSVISILYNFGTSSIPIEVLVDIDKSISLYMEKLAKKSHIPTKEEENKYIDEAKKENEMKEELKKQKKDGK